MWFGELTFLLCERTSLAAATAAAACGGPLRRYETAVALLAADEGDPAGAGPRPHQLVGPPAQQQRHASRPRPLQQRSADEVQKLIENQVLAPQDVQMVTSFHISSR